MPPSAARSHLPRAPSKPDTEFPRRTLLGSSLNKLVLCSALTYTSLVWLHRTNAPLLVMHRPQDGSEDAPRYPKHDGYHQYGQGPENDASELVFH